jgi:glycosyltransferase involved in cell wall biosynthesis
MTKLYVVFTTIPSHLFIHLFYESFGMPLLEAMACGCPIIASRIPSTIEVARDCPVYFEPEKTDDLLRAFDIVLSEGRNSEWVQTGLEIVKAYSCSWDKMPQRNILMVILFMLLAR